MTKLIIANWKSHKALSDVQEWCESYTTKSSLFPPSAHVVVCPPFPLLSSVAEHLSSAHATSVGVQDLSSFPAGAYTGAVSTLNLEGIKISHAIIGHSERRRYFHETHQEIANKVDQALQAGIKPVLCIDEPYLKAQANTLNQEQMASCIVAYEPLEAIGSGDNEPVESVIDMVQRIKEVFGQVPVLYGGSVAYGNAQAYFEVTDGVILGSGSLTVDTLAAIVSQAG